VGTNPSREEEGKDRPISVALSAASRELAIVELGLWYEKVQTQQMQNPSGINPRKPFFARFVTPCFQRVKGGEGKLFVLKNSLMKVIAGMLPDAECCIVLMHARSMQMTE